MSEDIALTAIAESTKKNDKEVDFDEIQTVKSDDGKKQKKSAKNEKKTSMLRRLPSFRTALRPDFSKLQHRFRNISCMKSEPEEEDVRPIMDMPRKSFDIGIARRMSLFIFTKRSTCVHPYHPFYPKQTTRKIYVFHEDK